MGWIELSLSLVTMSLFSIDGMKKVCMSECLIGAYTVCCSKQSTNLSWREGRSMLSAQLLHPDNFWQLVTLPSILWACGGCCVLDANRDVSKAEPLAHYPRMNGLQDISMDPVM